MEKTYKVTITTKRGFPMPEARRVQTAVWGCDMCLGTGFKDVTVEEVEQPPKTKLKVDYNFPLYAVGRLSPNTGKEWLLMDYFNTEKKAYNAKAKCEKNTAGLGAAFADDKFAVFAFCPSLNIWKML